MWLSLFLFADFLLTYFFVSQVFPCLRHSQALVIHNSRTSSFVVHYWRSSYEQELKQALFLFADFLLTKNVPDSNLYIADSCQGRITVVPPLFMNILIILIKKVTLLTGYATCMLNSLSDTINISFPCNARPRRKLLLIHLRISQTHSLRLSMLTFHHRQLSVMYLPKVLF